MAKVYIYGYNDDADINQVNKFRINETYYNKDSVTFVYQPLLLQFFRNGSVFLQGLYTEIYLNRALATDIQQIKDFIDKYCFTVKSAGITVQSTDTVELILDENNVLTANVIGGLIANEVDFGDEFFQTYKIFNIIDDSVRTDSKILLSKSIKSPSDNRDSDEIFAETLELSAQANQGNFDLYVKSLNGTISGKYILNYSL